MIHFIPESPTAEAPGPYAEAVARLLSIRQALSCVERVAGNNETHRDSEARLALGFPAASAATKRCFDARSARVAGAAAAGLDALAFHHERGTMAHPAALALLKQELAGGIDSIDQLFSL